MALGLAVLGSQLPDIDTTTSTIGKIFFPLSSFLEDRFPHRSITHSLLATGFIAAVSLPIGYFLGNWFTAIALPLGHLLACFSDCFTKQGVQLFFPDPAWAISVSNPKYLSGSLTVDFPEEVKLPILPDQYQTVSLSGAAVNLEYCRIEGAISVLREQYAIGTVTAKIIMPRPKG